MGQNQNLIPSSPSLKDLLNYFEKALKLNFNCHHVGTIQSFNSVLQTAQATINYTKSFLQINGIGNLSEQTPSYPTLIDCPVICLGGGNGSLTFPIAKGDECLVLFNDRDIDNWFSGSSSSAPATPRLHAFSDAVILVGLRSKPNVLLSYDTSAVTLQKGQNSVKIFDSKVLLTMGSNTIELDNDKLTATLASGTELDLEDSKFVASLSSGVSLEVDSTGKVKITNASGEFVAALVQLFTDIQNGLVTTMLGPEPLVMPTFAADLALFETFKS